jgi:DNA-binding transcriptional MocR family regulator
MHLLVRLPRGADDTAIAEQAANAGIRISALSEFRIRPGDRRPGLVAGYGRLHAEATERAVRALAKVIAPLLP